MSRTSGLRPLNWKDDVRGHAKIRHLAQRRDQLVGETVAEVLLVVRRAQIRERKHRRGGHWRQLRWSPPLRGIHTDRKR